MDLSTYQGLDDKHSGPTLTLFSDSDLLKLAEATRPDHQAAWRSVEVYVPLTKRSEHVICFVSLCGQKSKVRTCAQNASPDGG